MSLHKLLIPILFLLLFSIPGITADQAIIATTDDGDQIDRGSAYAGRWIAESGTKHRARTPFRQTSPWGCQCREWLRPGIRFRKFPCFHRSKQRAGGHNPNGYL